MLLVPLVARRCYAGSVASFLKRPCVGQYSLVLMLHAALEYWFNAANDGLIPKRNNLLVSPNPSVVHSRS